MISFNIPPYTGNEFKYIKQAVQNNRICGDGHFNLECMKWLETKTGTCKSFLTTSCS